MDFKEGKLTRPYSSKGTKMTSMGELTFFLGLQVKQKKDGIFISQDKYVAEILKKFSFTKVKTASTPMETQKPLLKDEDGEEIDVHMYRYQVNPKVSYLHAVKRIFRYLKGQLKLGLCYPKDSPFDLVAYTDSDYARASLDRKSTTEGCQFLGCRLISWQCKKLIVVANSTTEAEYVAASSCYGQNGIGVYAGDSKFNAARHKLVLLGGKLRMVKTVNGKVQLQALVDGKKIIVTKASVRRDLQLNNEEDKKIFGNMKRIGKGFSGRDAPLFPTMMMRLSRGRDGQMVKGCHFASSFRKQSGLVGNIDKIRSKATLNEPSFLGTSSCSGPRCQDTMGDTIARTRVKKLEKKGGSKTHKLKRLYKVGRSARVISSDEASLGDQEDASKQGRKIDDIDKDAEIKLVDEIREMRDEDMFGDKRLDFSAATITNVELTLAQTLAELKSTRPKAKGLVIHEEENKQRLLNKKRDRLAQGRKAQQVEEANIAWDDIQPKIDVDYQLAERLQTQEQQKLTIEEKSTFEVRAEGSETRAEGGSKRARDELKQDSIKKQKMDDDKEAAELKSLMRIVPDEEEVAIDAIPLATKPPSNVVYKIIKEGKINYFQIIRADGSSKRHSAFIRMLKSFDREDLETLWKLVKAKHETTRPEEGYERVLWGALRTMFEHHVEDTTWRNLQGNKVLIWKLFDSCRVHFVSFLSSSQNSSRINEVFRSILLGINEASVKKLKILKENIKFRGGLLGLKDFMMILKLLLLRTDNVQTINTPYGMERIRRIDVWEDKLNRN
ncbi:uncharacterized mitochondrial protein-like protein [Tanacetum coccineum]